MSISAVAGASSFTPPVAQNQALQAKASGVDSDHDGDTKATDKAKEAQKLSPPVNANRGRNLDIVA